MRLLMKPVLRYLIDITGQFDRRMIERALVEALQPLAGADEVSIFELFDAGGQHWMRRRADRVCDPAPARDEERHHSHLVSEHPALMRCIEQHAAVALAPGPAQSIIHWMPIWRGEKAGSCVCLVREMPLAQDDLEEIGAILQIYKNFLALLDYSEEDSLTGLLNRKTFDQQFGELVGTLAGDDLPPLTDQPERRLGGSTIEHWLGVIDIDHFKQVNDRYGHLYGDEVLILLANILKRAFREQDRVFRFGGEEFVVLLRATTLDNARKSFERLREAVGAHCFPQIDHVTVSIGFVSIGGQTPVTILGQADQALYFAKEHGRNQVRFYDELVSSGDLGATVVNNDVDFF